MLISHDLGTSGNKASLHRATGDLVATASANYKAMMAVADGLLVVPGTSEGFAEGDVATVQLLDGTTFQNEAGFEGRL